MTMMEKERIERGKKDGDKKGFGVETWPVFVGKAVWALRATL
jgi:hypothetical protein